MKSLHSLHGVHEVCMGLPSNALSVVSSSMYFSNSSWRRFLVAGESDGDAGDWSYHSGLGEPYMTSLPEDGERRPMSLRQDSDEPPAGGGGAVSSAPQLLLCALTTAGRSVVRAHYVPSPQRRTHPRCGGNTSLRLGKFGWPARHDQHETVRVPMPAPLPPRALPRLQALLNRLLMQLHSYAACLGAVLVLPLQCASTFVMPQATRLAALHLHHNPHRGAHHQPCSGRSHTHLRLRQDPSPLG